MKRERSIAIVAHSPRTVRLALDDRHAEAGGAELQLAWAGKLLKERGWLVNFIVPMTGEETPLGEVGGFRIIPAHSPGQASGGRNYLLKTVPTYWRALKQADAGIYLHRGANGLAGWTALFCQVHRRHPVLAAASNLDVAPDLESGEGRPSLLNRTLYGYFLNHCRAVLAQNQEQGLLYAQRTGRQAHVVPNVTSVPERVMNKTAHPTVAWAGAIRACKRPLWVLDISRELPEVEFIIAGGPNPGEEALWEQLQHGAADVPNVKLLGWVGVGEVETLIGQAWVSLCTSQMEGFPNVYLMAWGQETPLVTSFSAGGLAQESGAGLVGADPAALAGQIRDLVEDARLRRDMGRHGRAYTIEHHSPAVVGDRYDAILTSLLTTAAGVGDLLEAPTAAAGGRT